MLESKRWTSFSANQDVLVGSSITYIRNTMALKVQQIVNRVNSVHVLPLLLLVVTQQRVVTVRIGRECPPMYNPADFCIHQLAIVPGKETECKEFVRVSWLLQSLVQCMIFSLCDHIGYVLYSCSILTYRFNYCNISVYYSSHFMGEFYRPQKEHVHLEVRHTT